MRASDEGRREVACEHKMIRNETFEKFAANATTGTMLALRKMQGNTFTEADRQAMIDGIDAIRTVIVQPVGLSCGQRVGGSVSEQEYERAKMQIVMAALQLWSSGKLERIEVDDAD